MLDLTKYNAKRDETIEFHTKCLIEKLNTLVQLNYITDKKIIYLVEQACLIHDVGKVNKNFQNRIKNQTKFDDTVEVSHNVLSIHFIDKSNYELNDYYIICEAVLNHHHHVNNLEVLNNKQDLISLNLIDFETFKVTKRDINNMIKLVDDILSIKVRGLLNKCDYSASSHSEVEYVNDFLIEKLNSLGFTFNDMQNFMLNSQTENVICVANTGMGKTEGALLWIGDNKGFFTLPIKTSINSIYHRLSNMIGSNIQNRIGVLHSDSFTEYLGETEIQSHYKNTSDLSLPLTICTLDQIFDIVFRYVGYEFKVSTLSYSKIVIDEIQMYDAKLLAYIIYGIKFLMQLGSKICVMTATLSPFVCDLLNDTGNFNKQVFTSEIKRHNVMVLNEKLNTESVTKIMTTNSKTLIVCNTVKKAQKLYEDLKHLGNIFLLHSKFNKKDRKQKELHITSKIEKSEIWIATQVVEASLDIDFDILITELSDLNGLFQRMGRCNRKGIKSIDNTNVFIFSEIEMNNFYFIDEDIYKLSKKAISSVNGYLSETSKQDLINTHLTTDNIKNTKYYQSYKLSYDKLCNIISHDMNKNEVVRHFRDIISYNVIIESTYNENIEYISENLKVLSYGTKVEKQIARNNILDLTINIDDRFKQEVVHEVKLSSYQIIKVVKGNYNSEVGLK